MTNYKIWFAESLKAVKAKHLLKSCTAPVRLNGLDFRLVFVHYAEKEKAAHASRT